MKQLFSILAVAGSVIVPAYADFKPSSTSLSQVDKNGNFGVSNINDLKKSTPPSFAESKKLEQEDKQLTRKERSAIKKQCEKLTSGRDAKDLSLKELRQAADLSLKIASYDKEWYEKSIRYLTQLMNKTKDSEQLKSLNLEIADLYFNHGNLELAQKEFAQYGELYPGAEHAEYAQYKKILCQFYQTYQTDQDQLPTLTTKKLAQTYLDTGSFKHYRSEIKDIVKHCTLMLYQSEVNVFNFYFKKKSYTAASQRLSHLKKEFVPQIAGIEPEVITLECRLAQAQGNTEVYNERLAYLQKKYPLYETPTRVASRTKKSHAERF